MGAERTIGRIWQDAVARNRDGAAYLVQHGDHWHEVGWAEAAERVENMANGLLARGVRKGDSFADPGILGKRFLQPSPYGQRFIEMLISLVDSP